MIAVYGMGVSGNCHKVRLLLELLKLPYRWVEIDSAHGACRTPEFLALNPNGKVPIVVLDDGRVLAESNAILYFLAQGTAWFAGDDFERARCLSWMFFEQYSHEPYVAVRRSLLKYPERAAQATPGSTQSLRSTAAIVMRLVSSTTVMTLTSDVSFRSATKSFVSAGSAFLSD
jgi:glutathione S-transferase